MRRALIAGGLAVWAARVEAQSVQPEVRVDVLGPPPASVQPGLGLNVPLGTYVRLGAAAGHHVGARRGGNPVRADVIARVTLDPFRQQRFALSVGGGVSYRGSDVYLAALLDVEGPQVGPVLPALQVGASGGLRAGLVLRRAIPGHR